MPNATLVYTNADKFIRRAQLIGYLGEEKDSKVSSHQSSSVQCRAGQGRAVADEPLEPQRWHGAALCHHPHFGGYVPIQPRADERAVPSLVLSCSPLVLGLLAKFVVSLAYSGRSRL